MQIHHPTLEHLSDYASGSLRLSHALCIAAHVEHCSSCRQQVQKLSGLGGNILSEIDARDSAEQLSPLKDRVMGQLDDLEASYADTATAIAASDQAAHSDRLIPKALRQFIPQDYDQLDWARVSPAIKITTLLKDKDGAQISLSRVRPGGRMPHHNHTGDELTVVLEGRFSDESGLYSKGDFVLRGANDNHRPTVTRDGECICLMVLDAPIEFTGWFTRLLNPLLKKNHAQS